MPEVIEPTDGDYLRYMKNRINQLEAQAEADKRAEIARKPLIPRLSVTPEYLSELLFCWLAEKHGFTIAEAERAKAKRDKALLDEELKARKQVETANKAKAERELQELKVFYASIEPFLNIDYETSRPKPRNAKLDFDRKKGLMTITRSVCSKKWPYDLMTKDAEPLRQLRDKGGFSWLVDCRHENTPHDFKVTGKREDEVWTFILYKDQIAMENFALTKTVGLSGVCPQSLRDFERAQYGMLGRTFIA